MKNVFFVWLGWFNDISTIVDCLKSNPVNTPVIFKHIVSSIWPIDKTYSSASTPDQSWIGSDDSEGILSIFKSSSIYEA